MPSKIALALLFLAVGGCHATPAAPSATLPAIRPVAATTPATPPKAVTAPRVVNSDAPLVFDIPANFYTLPNGSAVESSDGVFLAVIMADDKVVGAFLSNTHIDVNPDTGALNINTGGMRMSNMRVGRNLTIFRIGGGGSSMDGQALPVMDADPIAGFKKALATNSKLKLRDYLQQTPLKDAVNKLLGTP